MKQLLDRVLYPFLLALIAGVFCVNIWKAARAATHLSTHTERLYASTMTMEKTSRAIEETLAETKSKAFELEFLQGLFNFIPQNESFLRTQKALMEEVQDLRQKIGRQLKGRLHIVVDTRANKLYLKRGMTLLFQADCSVGRGGVITDKATGRKWEFLTPRGKFKVLSKMENPVWIKPDWAFTEAGETPPPPGDPKRRVEGELGAYVLTLGDGYLIHGTKSEQLLGTAVSHGCVRLGAANLERLYHEVPTGTEVYIY